MANEIGIQAKGNKFYLNGNEIGGSGSDGGSSLTLQPAQLVLPKYMDVAVGRQCDFFLDDYLINPYGLEVRYGLPDAYPNADGVYLYDRGHLRITAASAGTLNLTVNTYCGDDLIGSQTLKIRKSAITGYTGTKNILIVGDSLVDYPSYLSPNPRETYTLLNEDGDVTINQIGTQGKTFGDVKVNHEGYGGKTWAWFVTSNESPFVNNGVFSFATYMSENFPNINGIDYCIVMLGTNDTPSTIETYSKRFIDKLTEEYPNCKVAVGIPALTAKLNGVSSSAKATSLLHIGKNYIDWFDDGKYKSNVTCIGQGCWIDRENDYPSGTKTANPYATNTIKYFTDSVHPSLSSNQGYKQWGRAVYCKIRAWIAGSL